MPISLIKTLAACKSPVDMYIAIGMLLNIISTGCYLKQIRTYRYLFYITPISLNG